MKRLLVAVALLFVPLVVFGQQSDVLLTPDGTAFTVAFERAEDHPDVTTDSATYLRLTARRGGEVVSEIIPATLKGGRNNNATLAYDSASGMLFVFWIQSHGLLSNQLMFASRAADGVWGPESVFGDGFYDYRKNLRVAVTRRYRHDDDTLYSGLSVHLAWWELNTTTGKYGAKYAMAAIRDGAIVDFTALDLAQFVEPIDDPSVESDASQQTPSIEVLSQPLLFTTPAQDGVVLFFGDMETGTLNQVRITARKVIGNGRLRVPGGRREGGFRAPMMTANANSRFEGVYVDSTRLALYIADEGQLQYVLSNGKELSAPFAIPLDQHLSAASAVDALRRLVNEHDN